MAKVFELNNGKNF